MNWTKIEVYNGDCYIGSFYTTATASREIEKDINNEYKGILWTRYNVGN